MAARKLVVYAEQRKELAVFEEEYGSIVVDCSTPKGMKSAKDCRKEIRDARSNLEDARKEAKAPVLAKGTQIDDEAKDIKRKLDELYTKFDGAIKAIENKKEIDAAKARQAEKDKLHDFEQREAAIRAKEIELGLREPDEDLPEEDELEETTGDTDGDSDDLPNRDGSGSSERGPGACVETICEPHIKVGNARLAALKKIRNLVEPTDQQPDGKIVEKIAINHDAVLADIWEIVDEFK